MFPLGVHSCYCPKHCKCSFDEYRCADGKILVKLIGRYDMIVTCKDTALNIACSDMPRVDLQYTKINIQNCPSNVISCISDPFGLDQSSIRDLELTNMRDDLKTEYLEDLKSLNRLDINLDADTSIPISSINSLKHLRALTVIGGKLQESSYRLNSTSLEFLYLRGCNISSLHTEFYTGLPNLKNLTLAYLKIENIGARFFAGLNLLEHVSLIENNLKSIDIDAFVNTPRLIGLNLIGNPLESLPDRLMQPLTSLQMFTMHCPNNTNANGRALQFNLEVFSLLPALKTIDMRKCFKLPENSKNITENPRNDYSAIIFTNITLITSLKLSRNNIYELPDVMLTNATTLKYLELMDNSINELSKNLFRTTSSLLELNLSKNNIRVLHDAMFANLTLLEVLNVANNDIEILTLHVFVGLKNLKELYLQNNNIMMIDVTDVFGFPISPFEDLPNLRKLNLSDNKIIRISDNLAAGMPRMQELYLANNRFKDIGEFQQLYRKKNVTIDLSNNSISFIKLPVELNQISNASRLFNSYIHLNHNPIICDCTNYGLFLRSKGIRDNDDPHFILGNSTCNGPPNLQGKRVTNLSPKELICNLTFNCPSNCTCMYISATKEVIVECNKMPTKLPSLSDYPFYFYNASTYTLNLHTYPTNISHLNITVLNVTNTNLSSILFNPNDHMMILDVSQNKLATIPENILKSNITLYVANNPLVCDCLLVTELTKQRVADYKDVYCADGKELSKIDVRRLCEWNAILMGYICMGIIAGIFSLKIGIAVHRHIKHRRESMSKMIFRRGSKYSIHMEAVHEIVKDYDLFVCFAHEDTEFVNDNLLPKLEHKFNQKVCIHHRDWIAGELIEDQIIRSVESSRRTIIILTEAFILSEWSYLEFRTAHNMSIREGKPRVIIIVLNEEIIHDEKLSKAIKSYTLVNTYLAWKDPEFWNKLERILPNRKRR